MRGKLAGRFSTGRRGGLIPACAGKTKSWGNPPTPSKAHPRVCGENLARVFRFSSVWGSSPRVRGKQSAQGVEPELRGLIPACAGKTLQERLGVEADGAHPRVCGENRGAAAPAPLSYGSSPRVRGKLAHSGLGTGAARLIPACAGKTIRPAYYQSPSAAHPRVCGENTFSHHHCRCAVGSSPRVRGKHLFTVTGARLRGLIPACAGKTVAGGERPRLAGAHPRVCGENDLTIRRFTTSRGSSPRVRGKPLPA